MLSRGYDIAIYGTFNYCMSYRFASILFMYCHVCNPLIIAVVDIYIQFSLHTRRKTLVHFRLCTRLITRVMIGTDCLLLKYTNGMFQLSIRASLRVSFTFLFSNTYFYTFFIGRYFKGAINQIKRFFLFATLTLFLIKRFL